MKIYNSLTRQKEEFLKPGSKVRMFVCGPTVYDYSHIGHARTYIAYDVIAKYLRHRGYDVFYLQNITDIDEKIIERAAKKVVIPADLAMEYKEAYYEDMKSLGITSVSEYAPATQYIPEIVSQVKRLLEKGAAYLIENDPEPSPSRTVASGELRDKSASYGTGGYYFDLTKFSDYGKLSGRTAEAAEDAISRIDESVKKRNKGDFALWKFSKPEETGWDTEFGYGRPGWHIEDTAITEKHFGPQYDLHGGARELIFPHHEAEIAQMESISGQKPMVRYWVHTGLLTINGQKMSKSLGNFITIRDMLKTHSPETIRFMVLSNHYNSPMDYKEETIKSAESGVSRFAELLNKLKNITAESDVKNPEIANLIDLARTNFYKSMDDDFNVPEALSHVFNFLKNINSALTDNAIDPESAQEIIDFLGTVNEITGIIPEKTLQLPDEVQILVDTRETARKKKDFAKADELREQIKNLGYQIDDTTYGPLIKKSP